MDNRGCGISMKDFSTFLIINATFLVSTSVTLLSIPLLNSGRNALHLKLFLGLRYSHAFQLL